MKGRVTDGILRSVVLWMVASLAIACVLMVVYAVVSIAASSNANQGSPTIPAVESSEEGPQDFRESGWDRVEDNQPMGNILSMA